MIGQFVARFSQWIKVYNLLVYMIFIPAIPLALWFSVLYGYFKSEAVVDGLYAIAMVTNGNEW